MDKIVHNSWSGAYNIFQSYNYKSEINLTKNERLALNNLSNNKQHQHQQPKI